MEIVNKTKHEVGKLYVLTQAYGCGTVYKVTEILSNGFVAADIVVGRSNFKLSSGQHSECWIAEVCECSCAQAYDGGPIEILTEWGA